MFAIASIQVPGVNLSYYREMDLRPDYHFYDYYVNTSFSAVHVPTDVYDQGEYLPGEHLLPVSWIGIEKSFWPFCTLNNRSRPRRLQLLSEKL